MMTIVDEEYERFLEAVENNSLMDRMRFCDCDDYEDEYSHNQIYDAGCQFLNKVKEYIEKNDMVYRVRQGAYCIFVEKISVLNNR